MAGDSKEQIVMTVARAGYPAVGTKLRPSSIRAHRWVYEYRIAEFTDSKLQAAADRAILGPEPVPPAVVREEPAPPPAAGAVSDPAPPNQVVPSV